MIPIRTLASAMLAAFGAIGGRSAAIPALPTPNDATVVSLSVVPATGRANVVIRVDGSVSYKHFTLENPNKIVVDLTGATLGLPEGDAYDGVSRGGITRIRYSQFTKTVVRVVLTLDAPHTYTVSNDNGELHISVDASADKFEPWQAGQNTASVVREVSVPKTVASQPSITTAAPVAAPVEKEVPVPVRREAPTVQLVVDSAPRHELAFAQHESRPVTQARQQSTRKPHITVKLGRRARSPTCSAIFGVLHRPHDPAVEERHRQGDGEHHRPSVGCGAERDHERQRLRRVHQSRRCHRRRHV